MHHIRKATPDDIPVLSGLYDALNDFLVAGNNYPGWIKGVYPTQADAEFGLREGNLFVMETEGKLTGSVILNHHPEPAYHSVKWLMDCDEAEYIVIHTLAVHPDFLHKGIGKLLMGFADQHAKDSRLKSIRLDVYEHNAPAIQLYEKCGYTHIDDVDLGLGRYGLHQFRLYEKLTGT